MKKPAAKNRATKAGPAKAKAAKAPASSKPVVEKAKVSAKAAAKQITDRNASIVGRVLATATATYKKAKSFVLGQPGGRP